jgi:hypothetical protein
MRCAAALFLFSVIASSPAAAQVDAALAGTWTLGGEAGRGGRGAVPGVPVATRLVIKVAPGQVTVDSNTGSAYQGQPALVRGRSAGRQDPADDG